MNNFLKKLAEISIEPNTPAASPTSVKQKFEENDRDDMARRDHMAKKLAQKAKTKKRSKSFAFGGIEDPLASHELSSSANPTVNNRDIPLRGL